MRLGLFFFFLLIGNSIFSENILTVDTINSQINLQDYAYIYFDSGNNVEVDNLEKLEWEKLNKAPSFRPGDDIIWLKYVFQNKYDSEVKKVLFISYNHIHKIDVFQKKGDTTISLAKTGTMRSFSEKEMQVTGYPISINVEANTISTVYIKYEHLNRPLRATAFLFSNKELLKVVKNEKSLVWFWRGMYFFVLILTLIGYLYIGDKMFLYYFLLNLGVSIYISTNIGVFSYFVDIDLTDVTSPINYTSSLLINLFFPLFINELTPIADNNRKSWNIILFINYGMIPFILISYFPAVRQSVLTYYIHYYIIFSLMIVFLLVIYYLVRNIYLKAENSIPLLAIYSIYVLSSFIDVFGQNMGLIKDSPYIYRTVILGSFIEVFSFMFLMAKKTRNVYMQRSHLLVQQKNHQKEIINAMVSSQEEERNRVGRELHDLVGANMAVIKHRINDVDVELSGIVNKTIDSVRSLSHGLVTPMVNNDEFIDEMKQLAHISSNEHMKVHIYFHKWPYIQDADKTTHLYRISQELLQNATKHSEANNVYFQFIGHDKTSISIFYEDDGIGFDFKNVKTGGLGLKSIQNRVDILGGKIDSLKSNGSTINIEIENIF